MKINLKQIPKNTWVSIAMIIVVIINHILSIIGKPLINLGESQITMIVNIIFDTVVLGYAAWKNHSFTDYAQLADEVLYALRDGKITQEEIKNLVNKIPEDID